jgi:hypothetical protein
MIELGNRSRTVQFGPALPEHLGVLSHVIGQLICDAFGNIVDLVPADGALIRPPTRMLIILTFHTAPRL